VVDKKFVIGGTNPHGFGFERPAPVLVLDAVADVGGHAGHAVEHMPRRHQYGASLAVRRRIADEEAGADGVPAIGQLLLDLNGRLHQLGR